MSQKTVKLIAVIICLALLITSFSFVVFLPAAFGATDENPVVAESVSAALPQYEMANSKTKDKDMNEAERQTLLVQRMNVLMSFIDFVDENYKDALDINDLIDGAYAGVINSLDDYASEFYLTEEEAEGFVNYVDQSFFGVGIRMDSVDEGILIEAVFSGSPAEEAGLKEGDIIIKIDGTSVVGYTNSEASALIRGEENTVVKMTVKRLGKELNFSITRGRISEQSVNYEYYLGDYEGLGYIKVSSFDVDTAYEFDDCLDTLIEAGVKDLIIDLRGNFGGYTDQAIMMADRILEGQYIMHMESQGKIIESIKAEDGRKLDMKVVTLVNENSASASGLFAAALMENGYPVVGTRTYGKGFSQQMFELVDGHTFKLSTNYFLTPKKNRVTTDGLIPTYLVRNCEMTNEEMEELKAEYEEFAKFDGTSKPVSGNKGISVYAAQQRLRLLGYEVKLTGTMDAQTINAVKLFQKENGLYPYAVLDLTTQKTLDNAVALYVTGNSDEDYQFEKAMEVLGYKIK